ncbi:HAUS augmin-like complex subunit [Zostera marina]|uniref:HAUS augmin-like complex subunit n=1 Tax=Zostera marina TaxID=29655 RepID=A0A0K9PTG2_ZOSMR|nr:HAUS augmin-like complex subunit [Zostera marina]
MESKLGEMMSSAADVSPSNSDTGSIGSTSGYDTARIEQVKAWLSSQFNAVGRQVPDFQYTSSNVAHLHNIVLLSQARTRASSIVADDLRIKAAEYRSQAVRVREILDSVGLSQERLPPLAVGSTQVIATVANLLSIRDTELSSFMVAMGDLMLRKEDVKEKRTKLIKESKELLEYTRKAIAKLNDLKKTLLKFENEVPAHEAHMNQWESNLITMDSKERQYVLQHSNYKALLNLVGYVPNINHGVLIKLAEHRKDLEKKTKPIMDTLRSYQDLPPDKALAALAIEDKKRQYAAAENYLEDVLHSALTTQK